MFTYDSAKKNFLINPKPRLKTKRKVLFAISMRFCPRIRLTTKKQKGLLPNLSGILSPNSIDDLPPRKKGHRPNLSGILSPNSSENRKKRSPQFGVNASPPQFKQLSSGCYVPLEKPKCTPIWKPCIRARI